MNASCILMALSKNTLCAIVIQRLRAATEFPVADMHRHAFADSHASGFPFVRHFRKFPGANPRVVRIQFAQNFHGQFRARNFFSRFNFQRRRQLSQSVVE